MREKAGNIVASILGLAGGVLFSLVTALMLVLVFGSSVAPEYRDAAAGPHPLGLAAAVLQLAVNLLLFVAGACSLARRGKIPALIGGAACLVCGALVSVAMSTALAGAFHCLGALCFALIAWLQWKPKANPSQQA